MVILDIILNFEFYQTNILNYIQSYFKIYLKKLKNF